MNEDNFPRKGFVFYHSWWMAIVNLPREIQGEVLTAIIEYGLTGETTESLKPIARAMLEMVKPQIDANTVKYENGKKGALYGKSGGAPKGNQNAKKKACEEIYTTPKQPQNNPKTTPSEEKTTPKDKDKNKDNNNSFPNGKESSDSGESNTEPEVEIDFEALKKYFNSEIEKRGSVIPKITTLSDERKKMLKCRAREYGKDAICKVIVNAATSNFLNGSANFTASFDWIFRPRNFLKVLEGNYNNTSKQTQPHETQPQDRYARRRGIDSAARSAEDYTGEI